MDNVIGNRVSDHDARPRYSDEARVVRRLSVPFLGLTLLAAAVLATAGYFWHRVQVRRIGTTLLSRAETLSAKEDWRGASDYIYRYLQVRPQDSAARIQLARYYDRSVGTSPARFRRAVDLYYEALGVAGEDEKAALRHRVAEMLLTSNRFTEAKIVATQLLAADPLDAAAKRHLAQARYGMSQGGQRAAKEDEGIETGEVLAKALEANPKDTQLAATWAKVLREQNELLSDSQRKQWPTKVELAAEADSVMDKFVAASPNDAQAYLARHVYRRRYNLMGAEQDLVDAKRIGPSRADVFLTAAAFYRQELSAGSAGGASTEDTQRYLEATIADYLHVIDQLDPKNLTAYLGLAEVYKSQGKGQLAIDTLLEGLRQIGSDSLLLQAALSQYLVDAGKLQEAEETLKQLDELSKKTSSWSNKNAQFAWNRNRDLIAASLHLRQGRSREAASLALPICTSPLSTASEQLRAWILLGDCYALQGEFDQAAIAFDTALGLDAKQERARIAAADAWMRAGQPGKAAQYYELALSSGYSPELAWRLGRARLVQQLILAPRLRDWRAFSKSLEQMTSPDFRKGLADPWRVDLLHIDYDLARASENPEAKTSHDSTIKLLKQTETQFPEVLALWRELAVRYEQMDLRSEADRALAKCESLGDPTPTNRLLASQIYLVRKDFARARQVLQDGLTSLSASHHPALQAGLAQVDLSEGKSTEARSRYEQLLQSKPQNLESLYRLADLALDAGDLAEAQKREDQLRAMEGVNGTYWKYLRARRLLREVRSAQGAAFDEAVRLQEEMQRRRPDWPHAHALRGSLAELQADVPQAIASYHNAIQLGEKRLVVYERLVRLLHQQGRFAEANDYLTRLSQQVGVSDSLSPLAISVATELKDLRRAELLAKNAVDSRPTDPMAWIWYGQVLLLNKQPAEAEAACRKAIDVAPKDVRAWNGLFTIQLRSNKLAEARKTLEQLVTSVNLSDAERALTLAQGNDLLGDAKVAEAKYVEASKLAPDSIPTWVQYTNFLLKHDMQRAQEPLKRLLELARKTEATRSIADNARRTLAAILAARGGDAEFSQAMLLLQQAGADVNNPEIDQRLQAVLLSQRADPDLPRAQQLVEDLVFNRKTGADGDRMLLASVYEKQSKKLTGEEQKAKVAAAREQYEALCVRPQPDTKHLVRYIEFLLAQSQWSDADRLLLRFEVADATDPRTLLLRIQWLDRQGRRDEIPGAVEAAAKRFEAKSQGAEQRGKLYSTIGSVLSDYQLDSSAEPWFRKAVSADVQWYGQLANCLVAQGKTDEAIRICVNEFEKSDSAVSATVLATILVNSRVSEEGLKPYQSLLDNALVKHSRDPGVLISFANLYALQNRNAQAMAIYKTALGVNPQNVIAMNNLAALLSEEPGKAQEALQYIEQAIQLAGPQSELLDTKGMVLVHSQRPVEALEILRQALNAAPADPRYHFHLAVALQRAGEMKKAKESFDTAIQRDIERQFLTATDRRLLQEMQRLLK